MQEEYWRPVPYSSYYSVSSEGRIRNNQDDTVFEGYVDEEGMLSVHIEEAAFRFVGPVIKLMSLTFFTGNLLDLEPYCIDGNDRNVSLDNVGLLYEDPKLGIWRQVRVRETNGTFYVDRRMGPKVQIVETGEVFDSAAACARAIDGKAPNITACLKGRLKHHKGFSFRYI